MSLLGHGGTAGLILEGLLAATVVVGFAAVWLRERRASRSRSENDPV